MFSSVQSMRAGGSVTTCSVASNGGVVSTVRAEFVTSDAVGFVSAGAAVAKAPTPKRREPTPRPNAPAGARRVRAPLLSVHVTGNPGSVA